MLNGLAVVVERQGRHEEAERLYREALDLKTKTLGELHPEVGTIAANLATLTRRLGRRDEARSLYHRALAIRERVYGADHDSVATLLTHMAMFAREEDRRGDAEQLQRRAIAIHQRRTDHPDLSTSLSNLAVLLSEQDRHQEAVDLLRQAIAILERGPERDPEAIAERLRLLARVQLRAGMMAQAESAAARSLSLQGAANDETANKGRALLGSIYLKQKKFAEAADLARQHADALEQTQGADPPALADVLVELARLQILSGRLADAETSARRALKIREGVLIEGHPQLGESRYVLGVTLARQRHLDEGIAEIERALTIWERRPPAVPIERLNAMHQVVNFHRERGALDDAIQAMERAIEYTSHLTARDHAAVGAELRDLSTLLLDAQRLDEAEDACEKSFAIFAAALGDRHPDALKARRALEEIRRRKRQKQN